MEMNKEYDNDNKHCIIFSFFIIILKLTISSRFLNISFIYRMSNISKDAMYMFGLSGNQFLSTHNSIYIQSEILANKTIREIECDIEEKWMKVREKRENEMDWIEIEDEDVKKGDVIELNANGVRWEGDSLNGNCYGYGCIYNEENLVIFSGFVFEGKKVCYGKDMYGDIGNVEYKGGYYNNNRFGYGRLYDKKNELIYEGEWKMNNPLNERRLEIHEELKEEDIHFGLEEIVIGKNCLNNVSCFKLLDYNNLKKLIIHKNCLERMELFCIENCNELVDVMLDGDNNSLSNNKQSKIFRIYNCPNCEDVIIGNNWYINCASIELNSI